MRKNRSLAAVALCGIWLISFCFGLSAAPQARIRGRGGSDKLPPQGALNRLTEGEYAAFEEGHEEFTEVETAAEGLGPMFNGKSCGECHAHPTVGGSSPDLKTSVVTRIGRLRNGVFDPLLEYGGPVLQRRSVQEEGIACAYGGEVAPPEATFASRRATPPVFGAGLVEAILSAQILARADPTDRNRDGISGRPNWVMNPETGQVELGRFGWKAHVSTLHHFSADAYLNEMGITNPMFPTENMPAGVLTLECDPMSENAGSLEDDGSGVEGFTNFMRFLAPLRPSPAVAGARSGQRLFSQIGCANCHTPAMHTGGSSVAALRGQTVGLYSDLLLHDMGPELADGIVMGEASGSEWRTTPLWGVSQKLFLLHDGRARTLEDAIRHHGGEATLVSRRFQRLAPGDQAALLAFLRAL